MRLKTGATHAAQQATGSTVSYLSRGGVQPGVKAAASPPQEPASQSLVRPEQRDSFLVGPEKQGLLVDRNSPAWESVVSTKVVEIAQRLALSWRGITKVVSMTIRLHLQAFLTISTARAAGADLLVLRQHSGSLRTALALA